MKNNLKTLGFALALALTCTFLLTLVSEFTAERRAANEAAARAENFLGALGVPVPKKASSAELLHIYSNNVSERAVGDLTLYEYVPGLSTGAVAVVATAVQFQGKGLWNTIYGVLALEPDLTTIRGIRFYKHEETPGLGGEIEADWFVNQFTATPKRVVSSDGTPGFRILKPDATTDDNAVNGITAATMTSDCVAVILDALAKELDAVRKGGAVNLSSSGDTSEGDG